jgi:phage antirepressor YoqD-like protein
MLYSEKISIGQNRLFKWLYENKYLKNAQTPYQKYMDMGLFEIVSGVIERSTTGKIWKTVKVTGKGIVHITQKLQKTGEFNLKNEAAK